MELTDLTHDERLALLGLMEVIVAADRAASAGEAARIDEVAEALGDDEYRSCLNEVEERFTSPDTLKEFLKTIDRQEARELIVGTVLSLALADSVSIGEGHILDWVKGAWGVEVQ